MSQGRDMDEPQKDRETLIATTRARLRTVTIEDFQRPRHVPSPSQPRHVFPAFRYYTDAAHQRYLVMTDRYTGYTITAWPVDASGMRVGTMR